MQYLQLLFFTLTSYFLCFRLLGEFLLPSSNILPRTYQYLHAIDCSRYLFTLIFRM
jgi:hypothetical protein